MVLVKEAKGKIYPCIIRPTYGVETIKNSKKKNASTTDRLEF